MYSYGKMPFRVSKSKFSADKLQNSHCIICSLSLLIRCVMRAKNAFRPRQKADCNTRHIMGNSKYKTRIPHKEGNMTRHMS